MILVKFPWKKVAEAERLWKEDCGALLIESRAVRASSLRNRENPGELFRLALG